MNLPPAISSRRETERVIAAGRVALASAALFGVWMDPSEPSRYVPITYTLHTVYVAYSVLLVGLVWRRKLSEHLPLVTHVGDIAFVSVLQYLTLGPSSPFFLYFVFSLFCAAMRWGWKATLATASVVLATYLMMSAWMSRELGPSQFEFDRFSIRTVYLIVTAGLLVYLGRYEERLRGEIEHLARWPVSTGGDTAQVIEQVIEYTAGIMGAESAVAIWDAGEEPAVHVARWSHNGAATSTHPPGILTPVVTPDLGDATFLCGESTVGEEDILVVNAKGELTVAPDATLRADLRPWLEGQGVASATFRTERVAGRVLFSGLSSPSAEIVPLTEFVTHEIGSSLDQLFMTKQMTDIAASEERIRVARDLHDGVLQSLTGIRLEIRAVAGALDAAPSVRDSLFAIERALAIEQRELRFFIGGLGTSQGTPGEHTLGGRLRSLQERISLEWKTPVTIRLAPDSVNLPERIDQAVPLMVHEAIVNALKHGQPSRVVATVHGGSGELRIVVTDDGHGFPFRGQYSGIALLEANAGPRSLLDRVAELGGRMSVESTDSGSRVEMVLAL